MIKGQCASVQMRVFSNDINSLMKVFIGCASVNSDKRNRSLSKIFCEINNLVKILNVRNGALRCYPLKGVLIAAITDAQIFKINGRNAWLRGGGSAPLPP